MVNGPGLATARGDSGGLLQRAAFALDNRRAGEAELMAGELLKTSPREPRALHILGCALLMQGRAVEAVAPLEAAARARHDPVIDTQLAIALRQAGRAEDALSRLRRAVKRQPPHAPAFHELGCLLAAMGRHDEAIEALSRGRDVAPMAAEFSIQLGRVFLQRREYPKAKLAFARALEIVPDTLDALFGIAKALQELGEYEAAAQYYRRCLASRPDPRLWHELGRCLLLCGKLEEASDCLRWVVRADPTRYGNVLGTMARSARGRFWLRPSAAARFLREAKA